MTKELRGFINRVRKAQDRIYSGKVGKCISIDVDVYQDYIRIDAYKQSAEDGYAVLKHEHLTIYEDHAIDRKEISESLSRMSQVIGFDI